MKIKSFLLFFVLVFGFNLEAIGIKDLSKELVSSSQWKPKKKSKEFFIERKTEGETYKAIFSAEPNEFYYKLSQDSYEVVATLFGTDNLPLKEAFLHVSFDDERAFEVLIQSKLEKNQMDAVKFVKKYLKNEQIDLESDEEDYISHFEYTPLTKDTAGNYTTNFFYSEEDYDEDMDAQYMWGKITVSKNNVYTMIYFASENDPKVEAKADKFLSSFQITQT